jgi:hypothetical protein
VPRLLGRRNENISEFISAFTRGALRGIRLGPGVLGTLSPVNIVGLLAALGLGIAFRDLPLAALLIVVLVIAYLVYSSERAYRYAEKNPLPALLGGSELLQLFRDQMSARDKSIVSDDPPVVASTTKLIESEGEPHV